MNIEARNKKTQEKKIITESEAEAILGKANYKMGMLRLGTSVVANGYELRPVKTEITSVPYTLFYSQEGQTKYVSVDKQIGQTTSEMAQAWFAAHNLISIYELGSWSTERAY